MAGKFTILKKWCGKNGKIKGFLKKSNIAKISPYLIMKNFKILKWRENSKFERKKRNQIGILV